MLLVLGPGQVHLIVQRAQGHVVDSVLNEIALIKSAGLLKSLFALKNSSLLRKKYISTAIYGSLLICIPTENFLQIKMRTGPQF